jgi:hypothetical protein
VVVQKVQHVKRVRILLALAHIIVDDSAASHSNVGRFLRISPRFIILFSKYRVVIPWKPYYVPVTAGQGIISRICNCSSCASLRVLGALHAFRVQKLAIFCWWGDLWLFMYYFVGITNERWNFGMIWWSSILGCVKFFRASCAQWALIARIERGETEVKSKGLSTGLRELVGPVKLISDLNEITSKVSYFRGTVLFWFVSMVPLAYYVIYNLLFINILRNVKCILMYRRVQKSWPSLQGLLSDWWISPQLKPVIMYSYKFRAPNLNSLMYRHTQPHSSIWSLATTQKSTVILSSVPSSASGVHMSPPKALKSHRFALSSLPCDRCPRYKSKGEGIRWLYFGMRG